MVEMKKIVDYGAEAEDIEGDYLKLDIGEHKVLFLDEIGVPVRQKKTFRGEEREVEQTEVLVEYKKKQKLLSLTKGDTVKSLWKQIMVFAKANGGVMGKMITIIVTHGTNQQKQYLVVEAQSLIAAAQKQQQLVSP